MNKTGASFGKTFSRMLVSMSGGVIFGCRSRLRHGYRERPPS
jgi:hypothetical protein